LKKYLSIIFAAVTFDQALKFWVKTNLVYGEQIKIFDWFFILFTENNGMAFGLEFGGEIGKYFLSIFRIVAICALFFYLYYLVNKKVSSGVLFSISLVLAGAIGNMIDSAFYGIIFDHSYGQLSSFLNGGYSSFLQGRVVDMFYFPIINCYLPNWIPYFGGDHFIFFRPIFNVADSCITIGVLNLLIFHRSFFK
tara:strand:+ start:138 stop:719 length:582 start_codon:yes stop_codon:yes gene_type:complete